MVKAYLIRKAVPDDCAGILLAHVLSIRQLCARDYTAREIEAWAGPKRAEGYLAPMQANPFFVAEEAGTIIGFGELRLNPPEEPPEVVELLGLYVHPDHTGRGVGRVLAERLKAEAQARSATKWIVRSTLTAEPFYRRMGFESVGRSTHRFRNGVEIACIEMVGEVLDDRGR